MLVLLLLLLSYTYYFPQIQAARQNGWRLGVFVNSATERNPLLLANFSLERHMRGPVKLSAAQPCATQPRDVWLANDRHVWHKRMRDVIVTKLASCWWRCRRVNECKTTHFWDNDAHVNTIIAPIIVKTRVRGGDVPVSGTRSISPALTWQ